MSLFRRTIDIDINPAGKDSLSVVTTLSDMFHDIELTLSVALPGYIIEDVSVNMRKIPRPGCREIYPLVMALKGLRVGPGFTKDVLSKLGGSEGCPNLVNLFLISAPLAMNAAMIALAAEQNMTHEEADQLLAEILGGVCTAYPAKKRKESRPCAGN